MPRKKKGPGKKATKKRTAKAGGKRKRTSQAELAKMTPDIVALLVEGASQASVADKFGVAVPTVARIAKKEGLAPGRGRKVKKVRRGPGRRAKAAPAPVSVAGIYLIMEGGKLLHVADSEDAAKAYATGYMQGNPKAEGLSVKKVSKYKEIAL